MLAPASNKQFNSHANSDLYNAKLKLTLQSLFHTLDEAALSRLMTKLEWLEVPGGDFLFRQGEEGDSLYILVSGRMKAMLGVGTADERTVGEIAQGECVGEMALITGEPRTATIYAMRDCMLARLSNDHFQEMLTDYPNMGLSISRLIINRLTHTMSHSSAPAKTTNIAVVPVNIGSYTNSFVAQLLEAFHRHGRVQHLSREHLPEDLRYNSHSSKELDFSLHNWLTEQEMEQDYVIYQADDIYSSWTQKCFRQADKIIVVVDARQVSALSDFEKEVLFSSDKKYSQSMELVVVYPENTEHPDNSHKVLALRKVTRHYNIRLNDRRHMQRLARMIMGKGIGLVLSGGGAKGFAHFGIFKALEEAGIPIDMVCGTSMGSIIAAAVAHEWHSTKMLQTGKSAFMVDKPLNDYTLPVISFLKGQKLQKLIKKYFGEDHIENLWLNFFCISGNYSTAEMVVIDRGPLWKAVTASVAIPGVLPPVVEGNNLLIDGGIFNNFPVDVMKARYGGKLIGVDLMVNKQYSLNYTELPGGWTVFLSSLFPFLKRYKVPSIASIIIKSTLLASSVHQRSQFADLEVILTPPVAEFGLLDMKSYDKIVAAGYEYANQYLKEVDAHNLLLQ